MCINAFICIKKCKQEYMYAYALWQDTQDTDSGVASEESRVAWGHHGRKILHRVPSGMF